MWKKIQRRVSIHKATKSIVDDEVLIEYSEPLQQWDLSIQQISKSSVLHQIYGRDAELMMEAFLDKGQSLEVDDRVILDNAVYVVVNMPASYHRHRTVLLKWQSNLT